MSRSEVDEFARRALQGASLWEEVLRVDPQGIAEAAQTYAGRMRSFSVRSASQLREMFEGTGFNVKEITTAEVPGEVASTIYAEIIAILT